MTSLFRLSLLLFLGFCFAGCQESPDNGLTAAPAQQPSAEERPEYALVIHGGAGTILKENMTDERAAGITAAMNAAMDAGEAILKAGGSSADAVEATIWVLEDSPYFNSGRGAVFTNAGINELDASFMTGHDQMAGAVGGITNLKHPISAARAVMEKSEHVLLTGKGAEEFAAGQGLEVVDPSYFFTQERYDALQRALKGEQVEQEKIDVDKKHGTVGCVALDKQGNLAAGTSTGGMTNKRYNRLGDSPIIGAGTYADNATAAVSCTGWGEYFIRYAVAYDVHARMAYAGASLKEAADAVIHNTLVEKGGTGGLIALDARGNVAMPFNTPGMYRGYLKAGGEREISFYED
ncbi:beta-aspartyl-peptidase (threonine type) [Lewinella marina]|uniref:Isoaspartyl peptidase n=1 Tax=Neolewinella marina TaxID=438751 RepID=A0A2G0CK97_9BACT|nr:isoaspartyl peptidase/L-asparaginase [Neolewinella marina]NJB84411.1 beta-aspartyl-peptidase (threonine type) [Neolewinella marina]PHL00396.1 beta-aspartyl-peptidase [Neolewinella marina]